MADRVTTLVVALKDRASRGLSRIANVSLGGLRSAARSVTRTLAIGTAAAAGYVAALAKLTERGGEVVNVSRAFRRVTGDVQGALTRLRGATEGLLSNYDLMVGFNRALTLGSAENVEQFGELARAGLTLGRALGVDAAFAVESLNLGIGRQSRLILDNLGLIVSVEEANQRYADQLNKTTGELTAQEQRIAFRNAALDAARRKVEELGGVEETAADQVIRARVAFANFRDELARLVATSPEVNAFFERIANLGLLIVRGLSGDRETVLETVRSLFRSVGLAMATAIVEGFASVTDVAEQSGGIENVGLLTKLNPFAALLQRSSNFFEERAEQGREALETERLILEALARQGEAEARLRGRGTRSGRPDPEDPDAPAGGDGRSRIERLQDATQAEIELFRARREAGEDAADVLMDLLTLQLRIQEVLEDREDLTAEEEAGLLDLRAAVRGVVAEFGALEQTAGPSVDELATGGEAARDVWERLRIEIERVALAIAAVTENQETFAEVTAGILVRSVQDFGAAWESNVRQAVEGSKTVGQAFAGALLGALASVARGFGQFYLAQATAALAQGILGDPRGFAAAAKYTAAALALFTLAGTLSAFASGGGGGGGGGAAAQTGRDLQEAGRGEAIIIIQGGILDMSDPRQEEALREALEDLSGRRVVIRGG